MMLIKVFMRRSADKLKSGWPPAVDSACVRLLQLLAPFYPNLAHNHCLTPLPGVNWGPEERARSQGTWWLALSGASFNGSLPPALQRTTSKKEECGQEKPHMNIEN